MNVREPFYDGDRTVAHVNAIRPSQSEIAHTSGPSSKTDFHSW